MKRRRVVITGIGQVSPVGNSVQEAWNNIICGRGGIRTITKFDSSIYPCNIAGEVKGFDITQYIPIKEARRIGLYAHYGIAASHQAIKDSGLDDIDNLDKTKVGVTVSSGIGGLPEIYGYSEILRDHGFKKISPFFMISVLSNMVSGMVAIHKGYQGPSYGMVSACSTSGHSIGYAMRSIQYGEANVMIAGGTESPVCIPGIVGFSASRALSFRNDSPETASRPWDRDRDGFVMGEGSGVLVLEEYEHAKKRDANIYAELAGFGMSTDAYHITSPIPEGNMAALGMQNAINDARINYNDVDYINAHGTSTKAGDIAETNAVKKVFKDHAYKLTISSTKSMTGHLLGAAGGIESIYTILSIKNDISPPTINIFNQDIEGGCDLDYCKNEAKDLNINIAISNSFGFGGSNTSLVFKQI